MGQVLGDSFGPRLLAVPPRTMLGAALPGPRRASKIGMAIGIPLLSAVFTTVTTGELKGIRTAVGVDALALIAAGTFALLRRENR
ncbi:hypothetical protein F9C11_23680 [Amycolatopsis sp. VS8301801F10]|uniref:hypothetical protein n=1 Tax=Amycolatopsis sp. VS8301801F10 TaxID=2652442 RepID=UPI0038FC3AE1